MARVEYTLLYHEMARRVLMKQTPEKIASAMALPLDRVKRYLRNKRFLQVVDEVRDKTYRDMDSQLAGEKRNLREELTAAAEKSFDVLRGLLDTAASETLRAKIAMDFLDREGSAAPRRTEGTAAMQIGTLEASIIQQTLVLGSEGEKLLKDRGGRDLVVPARDLVHPTLNPEKWHDEQRRTDDVREPERHASEEGD